MVKYVVIYFSYTCREFDVDHILQFILMSEWFLNYLTFQNGGRAEAFKTSSFDSSFHVNVPSLGILH